MRKKTTSLDIVFSHLRLNEEAFFSLYRAG